MKISQREMIISVATLATVLGGATWWMIDGKIDEWKAKAIEVEKLEQQIRLDQRRIKMQEQWLGELNNLQKDLRVFDVKQRSVAPELMKTIKTISNKHGVDITRHQPRGEKPTGDLFELGINCTWQGALESMVGFLAELQQQGVRYDVRTLNVQPLGKNSGKLKGNMVIHCVYTRKPTTQKK